MAEIIVDQTDLNINITPNTTQLNVFTGGYACAQGNTTEFQYNNGGVLAGSNGLTYNSGTETITAANLTVTNNTDLGDIGNITITGGNIGEVLQTDGAGGLSFAEVANANYANFAGTVLTNAQPNITSVGNLSNLTVTGNVTANYFIGNGSQLTGIGDGTQISNGTSNVRVNSANGNVSIGVNGNANILVATSTGIIVAGANLGSASNVIITGGNNGYFLQTDGTGNLTWAAGGNVTGNGVPGGANTQVQFNDGGSFGGKAGFTFNRTTNLLSAPGNISIVGKYLGDGGLLSNIAGGAFISNGNSNVSIATLNGNVTVAVNNVATTTFANNVINVAVAINTNSQINSTVANGTAPLTVISQTKVSNLNADLLDGFTTATANTANTIALRDSSGNLSANYFIGNGSSLASITGANVTGTVANATSATSAITAGTVTTAAQPNITSLGTLSSLNVSGTASIFEAIENVALIANQTGTYNFDLLDGSIQYATANATANLILNFRGNSTTTANTMLANGKSIIGTYLMTLGNTAYNISNIQIDGSNASISWTNGVIPISIANSIISYTFTIIKTSTTPTYKILGSGTIYQ